MSTRDQPPQPAYRANPGSALHVDRTQYGKLAAAPRQSVAAFTLPIRSGRAWTVPAAHIVRISTPEGAQVGDLNVWHAANPRERFWAARTRQLHASHVTAFDRLWSVLPYLRPLATIVADSLAPRYGVDAHGGRCHDLLGTRCDPYVNALLAPPPPDAAGAGAGAGAAAGAAAAGGYDFHCHSNLTRAILPFGLAEADVHDVLNLFQVTGLDAQGRYFMGASPAEKGDFIEFFAEVDLLMALSTCPGGDLSMWGWGEGGQAEEGGEARSMVECCRPLHVEVFRIVDEDALQGWKPPESPVYRGMHGMTVPSGEVQSTQPAGGA